MKGFPLGFACIGLAVLAGLTVIASEAAGAYFDLSMKIPVCAGGLAGIVLGIGGLIFAVKLAGMKHDKSAGFWTWWGTSMLTRLFLMVAFALVLASQFKAQMTAALLSMAVVYLIGMFAESAWLAQVYFQTEKN